MTLIEECPSKSATPLMCTRDSSQDTATSATAPRSSPSREVSPTGRATGVDTPKSGKGRVVVVPPHVRAHIEAHLAEHVGQGPEALLFPASRGGCHLDDKMFRTHFSRALKTVGREGVRVHDAGECHDVEIAEALSRLAEAPSDTPYNTTRGKSIS